MPISGRVPKDSMGTNRLDAILPNTRCGVPVVGRDTFCIIVHRSGITARGWSRFICRARTNGIARPSRQVPLTPLVLNQPLDTTFHTRCNIAWLRQKVENGTGSLALQPLFISVVTLVISYASYRRLVVRWNARYIQRRRGIDRNKEWSIFLSHKTECGENDRLAKPPQ